MTQSFEPHNDLDIDYVWNWFEFQETLILESRARVLRGFRPGNLVRDVPPPSESRFIDFTPREVEEFFDAQIAQLELLAMFEILAIAEAILRIEFKARVASQKEDGLSRRFWEIQLAHGDKIRLDDILDAMKEEGVSANVVADFRGALRLRHWLAHGRYWRPKLSRRYAPGDVFEIARALIDSIPPTQ